MVLFYGALPYAAFAVIFSEGYRRCPRSMDYFVSMYVSLFLFSTCSLVQVTANENHLKSREVAL